MEFDVFIEELKLAIEYQGRQHYRAAYWAGPHYTTQLVRDEEKRNSCKQVRWLLSVIHVAQHHSD